MRVQQLLKRGVKTAEHLRSVQQWSTTRGDAPQGTLLLSSSLLLATYLGMRCVFFVWMSVYVMVLI